MDDLAPISRLEGDIFYRGYWISRHCECKCRDVACYVPTFTYNPHAQHPTLHGEVDWSEDLHFLPESVRSVIKQLTL